MTRQQIFNKTKGRCAYCGKKITLEEMHIEHMIPKSKGGKGNTNLVPSCPECNLVKGDLTVEEFREKIELMIINDLHGRMIRKFFKVKPKTIEFYFEKNIVLGEIGKNGNKENVC